MTIHCKYDELVSADALKPHPKNANKHPEDQIERLAKILNYQGWRYPIKVSRRSGFVTSGHGRILAAKHLGWERVPVNYQDYEDDDQEHADVHSDNSIAAWAELDLALINTQIGDFDPGFDIDLLGIKDFVLDPSEKEFGSDEDEVPEAPPDPVVKRGELWILGEHRLLIDDCTAKENVERLMAGERADILLWDPPWNVGFEYNSHDDTVDHAAYGKFLASALDNFSWASGPDFVAVVWQSEKNWTQFHHWFPKEARIVAVMKNFVSLAKHFLQRAWDPALMWTGKDFKYWRVEGHNQRDYFLSNTAATHDDGSGIREGGHPCPRQVDTYEYFLTGWSKPMSHAVDFSAGSGTCFVACEKTNRRCFGMEIDPHYGQVIIERWQKFSNKKAVREDGVTFDSLKIE